MKPVTYRSIGAVGAAAMVGTLGAMPSAGADIGNPTGECVTDVAPSPLGEAEATLAVAAAALEKTKTDANEATVLQIDAEKQHEEASTDYEVALLAAEDAVALEEESVAVVRELESEQALLLVRQDQALALREAAVEQQANLLSTQTVVEAFKAERQKMYLKALDKSAATTATVNAAEDTKAKVRAIKEIVSMEAAEKADLLAVKSLADTTKALAEAERQEQAADLVLTAAKSRFKAAASSDSYTRLLEAKQALTKTEDELAKLKMSPTLERYFDLEKKSVASAEAANVAKVVLAAATTERATAGLAAVEAKETYDAAVSMKAAVAKTSSRSLSKSKSATAPIDPAIEAAVTASLENLNAAKSSLADADIALAEADKKAIAADETAVSVANDLKAATATVSKSGELGVFQDTTTRALDLKKTAATLAEDPAVILAKAAERDLTKATEAGAAAAKQRLLTASLLKVATADAKAKAEQKVAAVADASKSGALEQLNLSIAALDEAVAINLKAVAELNEAEVEVESATLELAVLAKETQRTVSAIDKLAADLRVIDSELQEFESSLVAAEFDLADARSLAATTEAALTTKLDAVELAKKSVDVATDQVATAERRLTLANDAVSLAKSEVRRLGGSVLGPGLLTTAGHHAELESHTQVASLTAATVVTRATTVTPMNQSVELSRIEASSDSENTLSFEFDDQHGELTFEELDDGGCRLIFTPCADWTGTAQVVITRTTAEGTTTEVAPILVVGSEANQSATVQPTALTKLVAGQATQGTGSLAYTGVDSMQAGALGIALVVGGVVTVLLSSRRRDEPGLAAGQVQ